MTKPKVLVIDDEKPTLMMFQLFLKAYGYEVLVAENGTRGLALFEAEAPPIVFTDIKMPGMDGFAVLDRIKAQAPETEVIVITGHGDMDLAVKALNHDATDFINKPIHRSALDAALNRAEKRLKAATARSAITTTPGTDDDVSIIEIQGSLNAASERELMDAYHQSAPLEKGRILLHFHENTAINGAGIGVLIQLLSESRKRGHQVSIAGISENFRKIFEMVGISRLAELLADDAPIPHDPAAG